MRNVRRQADDGAEQLEAKAMRSDFCPMANEPCQSMCDAPCTAHRLRPAGAEDIELYKSIAANYTAPQPAERKPEPQAQAVEPRWTENERNAHLFLVADRAAWLANNFNGTQEHYDEAIAKLRDYAALILEVREALAKKDAALQACVEAMKEAYEAMYSPRVQTQVVARVHLDAAITHANQVLGKEGA